MRKDSSNNHTDFLNLTNLRIARRRSHPTEKKQASEEGNKPHVIFCGGFHSTMLGNKAAALALVCEQEQWRYTRFDYRGHGESDGKPEAFTLADWLDDVLCVIDNSEGPILLVGSSMGGWLATLAACRRAETVRGLLLLAAAPDFLQELIQPRLSASDIWDLKQGNVVLLANAYADPYPITQALLDSGSGLSVLSDTDPFAPSALSALTCPVRMIHGTADTDVPYTLSLRLMERVPHVDAQCLLMHKADHRLSDEKALGITEGILKELGNVMIEAATHSHD